MDFSIVPMTQSFHTMKMNGLLGIGNIEKFEVENTRLGESSKTDFKDSSNKVFDLTL